MGPVNEDFYHFVLYVLITLRGMGIVLGEATAILFSLLGLCWKINTVELQRLEHHWDHEN